MKTASGPGESWGCCVEPLESRIAPAGVAAILLGDLDGANGFKLSGGADSDGAGRSVSSAGDVNGDGFADLIIGASGADAGGESRGASYVVFGKAGGFAADIDLSALDGSNGFELTGVVDGDSVGTSVSGAGDVNGDGFDDLIIGAPHAGAGGTGRGVSYVLFGKAGDFGSSVDLAALDGTNGFKLTGVADFDYSGSSVSSAGDVNGDGFSDVIVGANRADAGGYNCGASYVIFGKTGCFEASVCLSSLDGTNGFKLSGVSNSNYAGVSVSAAGDVNGDGFGDLVIGAVGAEIEQRGAAYVVFGKSSGFLANLDLSALNGSNGFKIVGASAFDRAGSSVSSAGDINGDGFDDVLVGAFFANAGSIECGASYVVFGKAAGFAASLNVSVLDGTNGFKLSGVTNFDFSGCSVSRAGDVNGDGLDDLLIGAYADEGGVDRGASYVVLGSTGGFAANVPLSALDGTNGFKLSGVADGDLAGRSVALAGDVNGDGFKDLIIGAAGADEGGSNRGAAYVVFGFGTADATIAAKGKTATFTDWDGDLVTVRITKGTLEPGQFHLSSPNPLTGGSQLIYTDFSAATTGDEFTGAGLSISARRGPTGGDGLVNVGTLDARGITLGRVNIEGDLQQFDADGAAALTVNSMGQFVRDDVRGAPLTSVIDGELGALTVKTDASGVTLAAQIFGPIKAMSLDRVNIYASGTVNAARAADALVIESLTVCGTVKDSQILAGYDATGAAVNADVQIGPVRVFGQWVASDLVAGISAGPDGIFATVDDALISGGNAIVAKIASVTIRGAAYGTWDDLQDGFGFVAEQIGSFAVGKTKFPLLKGPGNDIEPLLVGLTGDVRVCEISA